MNEIKRNERNTQRLQELYPTFRNRIEKVIKDMEEKNFRPRIQSAWRSPEDQLKAFHTHHSELEYGFHNVQGQDGKPEALAVDLLDDDFALNPKKSYLLQLAAAAESHGLETGIRWGLPEKLRSAVDAAIANKDWEAKIKIGWDPTHIQPRNLKIEDTKPPKSTRPT